MQTQPSLIKRVFFIITINAIVGLVMFAIGEFAVRWYVEGGPRAAFASFLNRRTPMSKHPCISDQTGGWGVWYCDRPRTRECATRGLAYHILFHRSHLWRLP